MPPLRTSLLATLLAAAAGAHASYSYSYADPGSGSYSYDPGSGPGPLPFECFGAIVGLQTACDIPTNEPTETEQILAACESWRGCADYRENAREACAGLGDDNPLTEFERTFEVLCSALSPAPPPPAPPAAPPVHPPPATMRTVPLVLALSLAGAACLLPALAVGIAACFRRRS